MALPHQHPSRHVDADVLRVVYRARRAARCAKIDQRLPMSGRRVWVCHIGEMQEPPRGFDGREWPGMNFRKNARPQWVGLRALDHAALPSGMMQPSGCTMATRP
jgi:hypothetical protein